MLSFLYAPTLKPIHIHTWLLESWLETQHSEKEDHGSSIHGIFQARLLEWVAISFSRASSWPRDQIQVSHIVGRSFYHLSYHGSPWSHCFMANRWENNGNSERFYFGGSKITEDGDCSHKIKRRLLLGRKAMTNLDSIKSRDIALPTKVCLVKAMVSPIVWMWELDYKESQALKNLCSWNVVLEKTLELPLDITEI